eukprot:GEMP01000234.1.p3 GENE.GEMP01000234.1~~GEMP01000234.1.p3  ORF type:complete len:311 (+),score=79.61 GEMP01000234.1:7071-8003(+)
MVNIGDTYKSPLRVLWKKGKTEESTKSAPIVEGKATWEEDISISHQLIQNEQMEYDISYCWLHIFDPDGQVASVQLNLSDMVNTRGRAKQYAVNPTAHGNRRQKQPTIQISESLVSVSRMDAWDSPAPSIPKPTFDPSDHVEEAREDEDLAQSIWQAMETMLDGKDISVRAATLRRVQRACQETQMEEDNTYADSPCIRSPKWNGEPDPAAWITLYRRQLSVLRKLLDEVTDDAESDYEVEQPPDFSELGVDMALVQDAAKRLLEKARQARIDQTCWRTFCGFEAGLKELERIAIAQQSSSERYQCMFFG